MGLKSGVCTVCGILSMLGCLFFLTTVAMVWNDNTVFLEHKMGLSHKEMEDKVLVEAVAKETDNTEPGQWRAWTGAGAAAAVATAITKIEMK